MTFKEMMRTDDKSLDQLDLLVRKILELSEGIVRDAEELMAMFDEEADGNVAGRVVKEEEESDHGRDVSQAGSVIKRLKVAEHVPSSLVLPLARTRAPGPLIMPVDQDPFNAF